jgi:hypothetical protein
MPWERPDKVAAPAPKWERPDRVRGPDIARFARGIYGEPDAPADFEQKRAALKALSGGSVTPGGIDLDFAGDTPSFRSSVEEEAEKYLPRLTRAGAGAVLERMRQAPATLGEKSQAMGSAAVRGMNAPALGIARLAFGRGGPFENPAAMRAAEGVADPASVSLPPERLRAAQEAIRSTGVGRASEAGLELLGATPGLVAGGQAVSRALGGTVGGPATLALHGGLSSADVDPLAAAGGGAAFGGLAHGVSAPLRAWLGRLPAVQRSAALQVIGGRGTGALTFAGADALLHGPDGERALSNAVFGAAMGGRIPGRRAAPIRDAREPAPEITETTADLRARQEREAFVRRAEERARIRAEADAGVARRRLPATTSGEPIEQMELREMRGEVREGYERRAAIERGLDRLEASEAPVESPRAVEAETAGAGQEARGEVGGLGDRGAPSRPGFDVGAQVERAGAGAEVQAERVGGRGVAPAAEPAEVATPRRPGTIDLGGMGPAVADNLYRGMFDRLRAGKLPDPFPEAQQSAAGRRAKAAWDRGEIGSWEDVRRVASEPTPQESAPVAPTEARVSPVEVGVQGETAAPAKPPRKPRQSPDEAKAESLKGLTIERQAGGTIAVEGSRKDAQGLTILTGKSETGAPVEIRLSGVSAGEIAKARRQRGKPGPESGAVDIGAAVEAVGERAKQVGREVGSIYQTLRRGGPASQTTEKALRKVEHLTAEERAAIAPQHEAAQRVVHSKAHGEGFRTLAEERLEPGKSYGFSSTERKYEGREAPTAQEAQILDALRQYVTARGARAEAAGVPGFKNRADRLPRAPKELDRVLREGTSGKDWKAVEAAFEDVLPGRGAKLLAEMQAEAAAERTPGLDRRSQFEFTRELQDVPAFVRSHGRTVQLFETNPALLLRHYHATGPARIAFGRTMGWPVAPGEPPRVLSGLESSFTKEGGDPKLFREAVRAAQGSPIERGDGTIIPRTGAVASIGRLLKSLVLDKAAKAAAVEPVGPITEMAGPVGMTRAYGRAIRDATAERRGGPRTEQSQRLHDIGVLRQRTPNRNVDPNTPLESRIDRMAEWVGEAHGLGAVSRVANSRTAAYAVDAALAPLRAGKDGGARMRRFLRIYGEYDAATADRLASGKGTKGQYDEATRRMVGNMVSEGQSALSRARLESRRWFQAIPFTKYAMTQLRTEARYLRDLGPAIRGGKAATAEWAYGYAKHLLGRTAQGFAWQALAHVIAGGDMDQFIRRWKANPEGEAAAAMTASMLAGSFGNMAYSFFSESGSVGEAALDSVFALSIAKEMAQALAGTGRYDARTPEERALEVLRRWVPLAEDAVAFIQSRGLAGEDAKDAAEFRMAHREFSRFRYGPTPRGFSPSTRSSEKRETAEEERARDDFRRAMVRVTRKMRTFAPKDEVVEEIRAALGVKGKDPGDVRRSILARRILAKEGDPLGRLSPEERRTIDAALKPEIIRALHRHDQRLTDLADWVAPPK